MAASSSSSAASKAKPAAAVPPPPPPPEAPSAAKKGFMRRVFPFLLAANLFVGVYVFARTYKRDLDKKNAETTAAPASTSTAAVPEKTEEPVAVPKKILPPISDDEQRQLYKWMLEEKRKIKPRNAAEKKKINEEKALLKEIIRGDSLPSL